MDQTLVSGLIPLLVPILIALGKAAIPILARRTWVLPILAPLLGALAEIAGYYAGLTSGDLLLGAILGGLGVCVREIADQAKKALTGEASTALRGLLLAIGLALASAGGASAEPTPVNRLLLWDYTGPTIDGFRVYYAPEAEAPRVYSDARRVEIADPAARQVVVLDVNPTATNRVCFRVTAFVGATESDYSGEACGFFGIPGATNARVQ